MIPLIITPCRCGNDDPEDFANLGHGVQCLRCGLYRPVERPVDPDDYAGNDEEYR